MGFLKVKCVDCRLRYGQSGMRRWQIDRRNRRELAQGTPAYRRHINAGG